MYFNIYVVKRKCTFMEWTWKRKDIQENLKLVEKSNKVNGELSSCDITNSGWVPSREVDIHNYA